MGTIKTRRGAQAATRITQPGYYHCKVSSFGTLTVGKYDTAKLWLKLFVLDGKNQFVPFNFWCLVYELNAKNKLVFDSDRLPVIDQARTFGVVDGNEVPELVAKSQLTKLITVFGTVLGYDKTKDVEIAYANDTDLRPVLSRSSLLAKDLKGLGDDVCFLEDLMNCEVIVSTKADKTTGLLEAGNLYRIDEFDADHEVVK